MSSTGRRNVTVFTLALKDKNKSQELYGYKAATWEKVKPSEKKMASNEWKLPTVKCKPTLFKNVALKLLGLKVHDMSVPGFVYIFLQGVPVGDFPLFSSGWVTKYAVLMLDYFL